MKYIKYIVHCNVSEILNNGKYAYINKYKLHHVIDVPDDKISHDLSEMFARKIICNYESYGCEYQIVYDMDCCCKVIYIKKSGFIFKKYYIYSIERREDFI